MFALICVIAVWLAVLVPCIHTADISSCGFFQELYEELLCFTCQYLLIGET
jgi:hypothetical protein